MPSRTKPVTVRLTPEEGAAIRQAAEALQLSLSALFEYAAIEGAHACGFDLTGGQPDLRRRPPAWTDAPMRWGNAPGHSEDSASDRASISLTPELLGLLQRVTDYIEAKPATFLIGTTLRYIANRKKNDRSRNPKLAAIRLPEQYR